jgi:hypothetical protein
LLIAPRTFFGVTSRHVVLAFEHAAIRTWVLICAPVVPLASESDPLKANAVRDKVSDCLRFADALWPSLNHPHSPVLDESMFGHAMLTGKYMPKTPKGHKRPADVVSNAVHVMKIATGEIEESGTTEDGKSKAAVELGRKGGLARARAISKRRRVAIAKKAARDRWKT